MDETMNITLNLSVAEVNTILKVLGKHPFDEIAALINKIKVEGEEQIKVAQETATAEAEKQPKKK